MATDTQIPDFLGSKKVEREDDVLSSDILEEKVLELSGNKVKQVERSSQVAETVNTELETGVPTNESETFFQALSVPMVTPDEGTPESCKAATTEDQEESKTESLTVGKPFDDESVQFVASNEGSENNSDDFQEANEQFEIEAKDEEEQETEKVEYEEEVKHADSSNIGINEKTTTILSGDEDQERKQEGNILEKDKSEDVVTSLHDKTFEGDLQEKQLQRNEGNNEAEVVETKESVEEDIEEKPIDILKEEVEERAIDPQEEKGEKKPEESVKQSSSEFKQEEDKEEIKPSVEREQQGFQVGSAEHEVKNDEDDVTISENVEETKIDQHVITEDKSVNVEKDKGEEKIEESVNKTVKSSLETEHEEDIEEIKPRVETEEKRESQIESAEHEVKGEEAIQSDEVHKESFDHPSIKEVCEETGSEKVEYEEKVKEETNENEIVTKVEEEEKEQEVFVSEKDQGGGDDVITSQDAKFEDIKEATIGQDVTTVASFEEGQVLNSLSKEVLKEEEEDKPSDAQEASEQYEVESKELEFVKIKEGIEEDTEEIKSSVETKEIEEKIEEEAIVNDDGQTNKSESLSIKEEEEDKSIDAQEDIREQKHEEGVKKIEQEEDTEEIKPSVETEQQELLNAVTIDASQTESHVESAEHAAKSDEVIQSDDGQKEVFDSPLVKEVCRDTTSEKVEYKEEVKETTNEDEIVSKTEDEEKEQEVYVSGKDQGDGDDVTSSQDATFEEKDHELKLSEEVHGGEDDVISSQNESAMAKEILKEEDEDKSTNAQEDKREKEQEESVNEIEQSCSEIKQEEDTKEIKPNVETEEKTENEIASKVEDENAEEIKPSVETKETEEKIDDEAIVNDDGQTDKTESPVVKEVYEEIGSENVESEEGIEYFESSNKTLNEDEIASKEENEEKEQEPQEVQYGDDDVISSQNASSKDIEETTIDQHTTTVAYFGEVEDKSIDAQEVSEKCDDGAKEEREENPKESVNKNVESSLEVEQEEDIEEIKLSVETETEQQGLLHAVTTDEEIMTETKSEVERDGGQKENVGSPSVNEVFEETGPEKVEYEEEIIETTNKDAIDTKVEEEEDEKEQEIYVSEKGQGGGDDVTSSQDATYEDIKATTTDQHVTTVGYIEEQEILKEEAEDKSSDAQEASEQYESGANDKIEEKSDESVNKVDNTEEIKPIVETDEKVQVNITSNEEEVIESNDGEKENSDNLSITKVHEEIHSEKVEHEGVELSNKDDQEKEQEQGEDDVTYSQDATSIEDLPEKKYDGEGKESEFVEPRESIEEDTDEIKSSVETKDVEEKINEEAIVNDDGQTEKTESPLVKEVYEEIGSENVESEEGVKYYESSSKTLNEDEIVIKEENEEKEQEPEEVQGGGDDVISSRDAFSEDIKEITIGQHATTVAHFREAEDKSIDAQEASKKCENEATDQIEQSPKESVNEIVQSSLETEKTEDIKPSVETDEKEQVDTTGNEAGHEEEVFEETHSEKVEISDKDEDQEKPQEIIVSKQDQEKDDVISSQDATSIENLQVENYDGEGKEPEIVKTRESIEEDTEEVKSSVETKEIEEKIEEEAKVNDDGQTEKPESSLVKEVCEEIGSENVESEEGLKHFESSNKTLNEDEIVSKEENQEEVQGGGDDVISSQNASSEDIKEKTIDQHTTTVGYLGIEDKSIDAQEVSEKYEDGANEKGEEKPEESVNEIVQSSSEVENTEEITPRFETDEKEQVNIITRNNAEQEEEVIEYNDSQKESSDNLSNKGVSEETHSKKVEFSDKDDDQEKKQEVIISEQDQGKDDVTSSQDATSIEELQEENYDYEGKEPEIVKTSESIEEDTEEVKSSVETKEIEEKIEEAIVNDDSQTKTSESPLVQEGCEEIGSENVESEEGVKYFESSSKTLNEDEIVSKEENQEKEQEPKEVQGGGDDVISSTKDIKETTITEDKSSEEDQEKKQELIVSEQEQDQGKDDVTCLQDATSKEDLQEKSYNGEGKEQDIVRTRESIEEDTEEIKSSVETKEIEEKIEEEAIVNDGGQTEKTVSPLVKEVCEEIGSENVESEEGLKYVESSSKASNEDEIASREENEEKEQELKLSETAEGGGDDVITSQYASIEDVKETTIDQHAQEDKQEQKPEEIVNKTVESYSEIEQEEDTKEIKPSVETEEKTEQQGFQVESAEHEVKSDDGQKEIFDSPSVKEVYEEAGSKKVEYEVEVKNTDSSINEINENKIVSKNEDEEKDQVDVSEEELEKKKYQDEGKEPDFIKTREIIEEDTEEIKSKEETTENEEKIDEETIVNDDGQTDKAESELNENETVKKEEIKEKEQEVIVSEEILKEEVEDKSIDAQEASEKEIVILSKDEDQEKEQEDLQVNEHEYVETREIIKEDNEVIRTNVETEERIEQEDLLHSITSDVGQSQIKDEDQGTDNEEKIDEGRLVNDDGQTEKSESPLVKEVSEVTVLEKAESEWNETETVTKEETQEKEQKTEELKVISSHNASNEEKSTVVNETTEVEPSISIGASTEETPNLENAKTEDQKEIAHEISYSDPILEPQVNLQNTETTDYPSESEESTKQAIESVCDVQTPEVVSSFETTKSNPVSEHLSISSRDAVLLEEVSSELGQPKEKIVEEKTVSDEITKKDVNLSDENDTTTKEEKCFQEAREIEAVEEKSRDLSEIREVKPQEDVKKNLELHEELKPTNELVIEEEKKVKAESPKELENIQAAKTPMFEFENKEKDDELLSELQNPEATFKTAVLEETNNTSETLTDELLIEKKHSEPVNPDTKTTEDLKISQKDVTDDIRSEVNENLIEEREIDLTKDEKVNKEETGEKGAKTDEENEEEDDEDNHNIDAPVMVEASKDIEIKTPKKSHNILSGVGSKVKHSIAKVKKAITGKSSHSKESSPKEKDQVIA